MEDVTTVTNAREMEELLLSILYEGQSNFYELDNARFQTFNDAMLLTSDNGIVIRLQDGSEYQITIVQSK